MNLTRLLTGAVLLAIGATGLAPGQTQPTTPDASGLVTGKLNVIGATLSAADRHQITTRMERVSRAMRATITIVITNQPHADMKVYAAKVYYQLVSNPSRAIVILIRTGENPDGRVMAGTGFVGLDTMQIQVENMIPNLRRGTYARCVNKVFDGILAQKT